MQDSIEMTKVGSDGTVRLTEDVRKRAGIRAGSTVIVLSSERGVMLGRVNKKFLEAASRLHARKKKISENEIEGIIQKVRYGNAS